MAITNLVFGQPPNVTLAAGKLAGDVTFPPCPPNTPGLPDTCVKVDVYRNQARGNPLPIFFGNLLGVIGHGVRATATAQIVTGSHTDCLKPWAILDRWDEWNGVANDYPNPDPDYNSNSTYDKYSDGKKVPRRNRTCMFLRAGATALEQDSGCPRMKAVPSP